MRVVAERIYRAYQKKEVFRVILMLPPKPDYEGQWDSNDGHLLNAVSDLTYETLVRGDYSLYSRLIKKGSMYL